MVLKAAQSASCSSSRLKASCCCTPPATEPMVTAWPRAGETTPPRSSPASSPAREAMFTGVDFLDALGHVPPPHVAHFVGHHPGQLPLALQGGHHAPEHEDIAAGDGKGVHIRQVGHVHPEGEGLVQNVGFPASWPGPARSSRCPGRPPGGSGPSPPHMASRPILRSSSRVISAPAVAEGPFPRLARRSTAGKAGARPY